MPCLKYGAYGEVRNVKRGVYLIWNSACYPLNHRLHAGHKSATDSHGQSNDLLASKPGRVPA